MDEDGRDASCSKSGATPIWILILRALLKFLKLLNANTNMKILLIFLTACLLNLYTLAQQNATGASDTMRQIKIAKGQLYLNFPVNDSARLMRIRIQQGEKFIDQFTIRLATEKPDYWVFF
ncbi:MAG: DUF4980 domain-containing protein, partial [Flavisolibacter sp.]|nr:DUF4980 domain-containing protein [Flavisolibacter sp.]